MAVGVRGWWRALACAMALAAIAAPVALVEAAAAQKPIKFLRYDYRVLELGGTATVEWRQRGQDECQTPIEGSSGVVFQFPDLEGAAVIAQRGSLEARVRRGRVFGGGGLTALMSYTRITDAGWTEATGPGCTAPFVPRTCSSSLSATESRSAGLFVKPRRGRGVTNRLPVDLFWATLPGVGVGGHGSGDECRLKGPLLTSTFDENTTYRLRRFGGVWHSWRNPDFGRPQRTLKRNKRCARKRFRQRFRARNRQTGGRCVRIVKLRHRGSAPLDQQFWTGSYRWNLDAMLLVNRRTVRR